MDFLTALARQPLFKLLGAIIVLILTELRPAAGAVAFIVWALWIAKSAHESKGWLSG
jgi:hypothetical protein